MTLGFERGRWGFPRREYGPAESGGQREVAAVMRRASRGRLPLICPLSGQVDEVARVRDAAGDGRGPARAWPGHPRQIDRAEVFRRQDPDRPAADEAESRV